MKNLLLTLSILLSLVGFSQSTYTQNFTKSGSYKWICPNNVTSITVECYGGGGGGGGANSRGAGGGGGGGYAKSIINVTSGTIYYLNVGIAGSAGTSGPSGTNGGTGGSSWFNASSTSLYTSSNSAPTSSSSGILASGGVGGIAATGGAGGAGGSTNYGTTTYNGGNGATGINSINNGGGGGGSSACPTSNGENGGKTYSKTAGIAGSGGGNGGAGGAYIASGSNPGATGTSPGGGGGGGYYFSNTNIAGGLGGTGKIIISYTACVPLFEQDFNSSTTISDYIYTNSNHTQFDEILSTISMATPVAPSINTTTSNKLRFNGTDGTKSDFVRSTDFITTPTNVVVKFDITFSSIGTAASQSAIFYLGTGFTTATSGVPPTASSAHSRLQFATSMSSTNGFQIRNSTPSNVGPNGTNTTYFTNKQTVTWVINNSGGSLTYLAPDGTTESVGDDKEDIWVGTTRVVNDDGAWGPTKALTDMAFYHLNGNMVIDIDNLTVNSIVSAPTSSAGSGTNCSSFSANWTTSNCNASLEVATNNTFTSMVSGYPLSVTSSPYSVTGLSAGTTYYYRLKTSIGSNSNSISSAYSSTQSITTTSSSVGGAVTSDQSVMSGGNASTVNLSGHTGSVIKWQRSTISDFSISTDVPNTTTSVNGASMGGITETIYYRAIVQNGTCPSVNSAYVTITVESGLPIELLYFKGDPHIVYNKLYWETLSENNNDYFTIEKTRDGTYFYNIAIIKGAGNSSQKLYYQYLDHDIEDGINYYILRQTDYDGKFKYSEIISVDNRKEFSPTLIKVSNTLGQEVTNELRGVLIFHYSDGTTIKRIF